MAASVSEISAIYGEVGSVVASFPRICIAISANLFPDWSIRGAGVNNVSECRDGRASARILRVPQVAAMSTCLV